MKKHVLAWLVFHANKSKDKLFYPIKNRILAKYGIKTDTVVQFIEGKKCFSCNGTGIHYYFSGWTGELYDEDSCRNCNGTGWYKVPAWNWLGIIKLGRYSFHQPIGRTYTVPVETVAVFSGYIDHEQTKYTNLALFLIFLIYDRKHADPYRKAFTRSLERWKRLKLNSIRNFAYYRIKLPLQVMIIRLKINKHTPEDDLPF